MALSRDDKISFRQWERAKEIFDSAVDLPPSARAAYLTEACASDFVLLQEVRDLLDQHEQAGSFLQDPSMDRASDGLDQTTFLPGECIASRFRIIRLIGRGGMGEVYEAKDEVLHEHVALKTLLPQIAAHSNYLGRFRRELQLARRITHPNIARVYELFELVRGSSTITFYTMEYVPGETLADIFRSGSALTKSEVEQVISQLAQGLDAAHDANVIHRDFKPENVLISRKAGSGVRAAITDFGLARIVSPATSVTASGQMIGTLAYMAPEVLQGCDATNRSDIYSFGVVLQKLGKHYCSSNREFDARWRPIVVKCLHSDPNQRYARAADAVKALALSRRPSTLASMIGLMLRLWQFNLEKRTGIIAFFILALLIVALISILLRFSQWKPKLREGSTILLTEIQNTTHDQELEAITDLMRNQIGKSTKLMFLERSRVNDLLQQMGKAPGSLLSTQTARELAWRATSSFILFTTLARVGNGYVLSIRIEQVGDTPASISRHWDRSFPAEDKQQLFSVVRDVCIWFRSLAEHVPEEDFQRESLPQSTTTSSWPALLLFSQAERVKAAGQTAQAIDLLEKSVQIDPDFSLAYMRLGDLFISLKDEKDGFLNWLHALDALHRRPVTQKEELRIRALFAQDSGDWKQSEELLKTFEILYPYEYLPSFYLSSTLAKLNRAEDALSKSKEAQAKDDRAYAPIAQEARLELVLGRLEESKKAIARLHTMGHHDSADAIEVGLDLLTEDLTGAVSALNRLHQASDPLFKSKSFSLRGAFLSELRQFSLAIHTLREGIAFDAANKLTFNEADKWLALAYLSLKAGNRAACKSSALHALQKENGRLHLLQTGTLLARAGFIADARRILRQLDRWPSFPLLEEAKHQIQGEIFLAQRRPKEAVSEMQVAAQLDAPNGFREYLARTLKLSGDIENARALYRHMADSPAQIWQALDYAYPGFWADMAETYVSLEPDLSDRVVQSAQARIKRLREFSSP